MASRIIEGGKITSSTEQPSSHDLLEMAGRVVTAIRTRRRLERGLAVAKQREEALVRQLERAIDREDKIVNDPNTPLMAWLSVVEPDIAKTLERAVADAEAVSGRDR